MSTRQPMAILGACAALACSGLLRAADTTGQTPPSSELSLAPVFAQANDRTPLMGALDRAGLAGALDDYNLTVGGFAAAGWSYNFNSPEGGLNTGRVFDVKEQDPTLHQLDLFVERPVDPSKGVFDVGGKVEVLYGSDARFIHSNGLNFYGDSFPQSYPDEQFDLVQAYASFAVPVGNGLQVTAGKFVTPLGYEVIAPTGNAFYSRSFLFGNAIPFTHTGITASYTLSEQVSVMGGVVRGWDQALEDANDMVSFLGGVTFTVGEDTKVVLAAITGPEQADNESDYRTVFDLIVTHQLSDELLLALNADYGWEADAALDGGTANWFGVAGYASYELSDMLTLNGRGEYYSDQDRGFLNGSGTEVWAATVGLGIKPLPNDALGSNLLIRPEIRFDYSPDDVFDNDNSQTTFGVDVVFAF